MGGTVRRTRISMGSLFLHPREKDEGLALLRGKLAVLVPHTLAIEGPVDRDGQLAVGHGGLRVCFTWLDSCKKALLMSSHYEEGLIF